MVSDDHRPQNPPGASTPPNILRNGVNSVSHPDDNREDAEGPHSNIPEGSGLLRGRRSGVESIASQHGSTSKPQRRPVHDYAISVFGHIGNVVAGRSYFSCRIPPFVAIGIAVAVWFLVLSTRPTSFPILQTPLRHLTAFVVPPTHTGSDQPLTENIGYMVPAREEDEGMMGNDWSPSTSGMGNEDQIAGGQGGLEDGAIEIPEVDTDESFSWLDEDVILRSTHGTETRDFRVNKSFLSFTSPIFKNMFTVPRSSSPASNIHTIDLDDPPRALDLVLQLIDPSSVLPATDDLTIVSEALNIADKYDIEVARSRLRSSLMEFAITEPLRVYAIAFRFGFGGEMKKTLSHVVLTDLSALPQLPEEFKFISATEYHRLVRLHAEYRKEVAVIAVKSLSGVFIPEALAGELNALFPFGSKRAGGAEASRAAREAMKKFVVGTIMKGTPLDYRSLALTLKTDYGIDVEANGFWIGIRSVLRKVNAMDFTV